VEWRNGLVPETPELLPGEAEATVPRRSAWIRLSVAPAATEDLLVQFVALFLVYVTARNFAVERGSLERLAWVGFATGTALALMALAQHLSGDREQIYWRYDTGGPVFGPFVNKNHFAFQIHLFAGLGAGLFLRIAQRNGLQSALAPGLLGGLGLMLVAVGFSQSRGGVIALVAATLLTAIVARAARRTSAAHNQRIGLALVGGVVVIVLALTAWLGWSTVLDRFASVWQGTADNRSHIWRRAWPLVGQFPLVGVGGGAYSIAELATRTIYEGSFLSVSAHNEYLEALIEGGPVRFALTVALAIAAVWTAARNYHRTRDPLLLGCVFGLSAVAIHSIGEFGIHTPSVALAAAVVAAYAGRRQETGDRREETATASISSISPTTEEAAAKRHPPTAFIAFLLLAALLVVLADWRALRVDRLRAAAALSARPEDAVRFLDVAARVRPNDPEVWEELASAHLMAAAEAGQTALAALIGFAQAAYPPEVLPGSDPDGHVVAALRAARMGRNVQPLAAGPHLRLGAFADRFARSDPAAVYFDRAKRVGRAQPDVWYVAGKAAAARGDWASALADWHESLTLAPRRLQAIARAASGRVPAVLFREQALPNDPAVWFAVMPELFPYESDAGREEWLRAVVTGYARGEPTTVAGFLAWGSAQEELANPSAAIRVWRRAIERFPDNVSLHDRLTARLEAEELYEDALPVLEWLAAQQPDNGGYRDRLAAAKHALKLKAAIDGR
jgi:O-antigen ligase